MAQMTKEQAGKILDDVQQPYAFWLSDNRHVYSLEELHKTLPTLGNETFTSHVNATKNDFANWIQDVIGDKVLAGQLRKVKTKTSVHKKIAERIAQLRKVR